ncbi:MAG: rhodanese-like domain-containing protein [Bacteriovoracales bacterium]|nr:rhodanese-like domain-containing protein [Bacteriovoracales bacterium]
MIGEISVVELKAKFDKGEEVVLLDCREKEEWEAMRMAQSVLVPLSDFDHGIEELESKGVISKQTPVVIHCRSGKRSMKACQVLGERGYTHLSNLEGGILAWSLEGFPIEGEDA